jgi:hypothetical protein
MMKLLLYINKILVCTEVNRNSLPGGPVRVTSTPNCLVKLKGE